MSLNSRDRAKNQRARLPGSDQAAVRSGHTQALEFRAASRLPFGVSLTRLFVYGTLRRGLENHRELRGATYLGSLLTEARCALVESEGYPALVQGDDAIAGELYAVDAALLAR